MFEDREWITVNFLSVDEGDQTSGPKDTGENWITVNWMQFTKCSKQKDILADSLNGIYNLNL